MRLVFTLRNVDKIDIICNMKIQPRFSHIKRILVFNPSFIGDAILTTPLINALHKLLPGAEVDFCVRPESAPLFLGMNVVVFDKRREYCGISGAVKFAKLLKSKNYDMVISLHKSLRSAALLKLAHIPLMIGFRESALSFFYTGTVSRDMSLHEVERNLSVLAVITDGYSLNEAKKLGGQPVTYLESAYCNNFRTYADIIGSGKIIGLNPGSVWATKRWPAEYFAEVGKMLARAGYSIAVFGGPGDKAATDAVKNMLSDNGTDFFDFADKVPFSLIPAVIKNMTALVTNDSAPLHIAVSQGVPAAAVFGSTVRGLGFYPYDNKSVVCENVTLDCRPCGLHGKNRCPKGHFKCMLDVKPEQVFDAVIKMVGRP